MKNCLVTKLSAVVDNPDLMGIGEFKIKFRPTTTGELMSINSSMYSGFILTKDTRLVLTGDCTFKKVSDLSDLGKDITLGAYPGDNSQGVQLYANSVGDCVMKILPCYGVSTKFDNNTTTGFPGLPSGSIQEFDGFDSLAFSYLASVAITDGPKLPVEYFLHDECIKFVYVNSGVKEDISLFGKYINLRDLRCTNNYDYYGSIESIIEGFAANGFEDGASVSIRFNNNENITFHGRNGIGSLPYNGQIVVARSGNSFTCSQSNVLKGTYTIGSGWVYTD